MRPLVLIELDDTRCADVRRAAEADGFRTECFSTAAAALPRIRANAYSLAVVGVDGSAVDPLPLCLETSRYAPVIAVTSGCMADTCARLLEGGADDCVSREVSAREIVARIHSVLRRHEIGEDPTSGAFSISISEMRIHSGGATRDLTYGETRLLALLVEHAPAPLRVRRMCELLDARRSTMESRIKSLRRKLGPGRLVSRGSLGYQLITAMD